MRKHWKTLNEERKSKYVRLAQADRDRYLKVTAGERRKYQKRDEEPNKNIANEEMSN
jgi:hypothetical protein